MSTQMPETVQKAWGEPAVRDFTAWLEGRMAEGAVGRDEFGAMNTRLTVVEHDVADIKVEQRELRREMNQRFDRVNERFDLMLTEMSQRFDSVNEHFDRMHTEMNRRFDQVGDQMTSQMRWSVSILAVVGTLVTILVGLGQLTP